MLTVGVDPQSRNAIFDFLTELNRGGLTIIYSTHYMEEATRLCSRIGIIDQGKLLALGTLDELLTRLPFDEEIRFPVNPANAAFAADWKLVEVSGTVRVAAPGKAPAAAQANQIVPIGSSITTASGGRAALFNGAQKVTLGANSRMTVAPRRTASSTSPWARTNPFSVWSGPMVTLRSSPSPTTTLSAALMKASRNLSFIGLGT